MSSPHLEWLLRVRWCLASFGVLLWLFYSSSSVVLFSPRTYEKSFTQPSSATVQKRVLLGIMSVDSSNELEIRNQFRKLFGVMEQYGDHRVCSLGEFLASTQLRCELVYTFVLGGNPSGPTILTNSSAELLARNISGNYLSDRNEQDMTFLNIQENMEQGKSHTWFLLARAILGDHNFDYVAKCDSDSVLDLTRFFDFVEMHLPPAPYNRGIVVGKPCDKLWWRLWRKSPTNYPPEEKKAKEGFLKDRYGSITRFNPIFHLYALGQFYMFSADMVFTIAQEVESHNYLSYMEEVEDHDISTMAFHSKEPIHFIFLSQMDMQFWQHDVKLTKGKRQREIWERTWEDAREQLATSMQERKGI